MHPRSALVHRAPAAWCALASITLVLTLLAAGCPFTTTGEGTNGGGGQAQPCSADNQCNDENPCTIDTCGQQGTCTATPAPDGDAPEQIPNDCKKAVCAAGKPTEVSDDSDFLDDSNDCTVDACVNGASTNTDKADNTPCTTTATNEAGVCNKGVCNATCSAQKPCQQVGFCADVVCDISIGQCITTNKPDGLPTPNQAPGDCAIKVCSGGMEISTPDDTDVPDDNNECTADGCANGMPASTDKAQSTVCSTGFCDGAGTCVTCTKDSECPTFTTDNACQTTTCTANHTCMVVKPPMGTVIAGQVQGDCKELQCDGMGNVITVTNNINDPGNDNNECTDDTCVGGVPTFTPVMLPQACVGGMCNALGQCGCATSADCTAPNKCSAGFCVCIPDTCVSKGYTCGSPSDGCFATLTCDTGVQNGAETDVDCGGPAAACATRCGIGKGCSVTTDCANGLFCADGVCCDTACSGTCEACTAAKKGGGQDGVCGKVGGGTDPDNECMASGTTCGLTGFCNGSGACEVPPAGTMCGMGMCASNAYTGPGACNGMGTCATPAALPCFPYLCDAMTGCASSCATDAGCVSGNYCSGGACLTKKAQGQACGANNECSNNTCVDGYCCNNICNTTCKACNVAGSLGTCVNVPLGYADPGTCNNPSGCNNGNCDSSNKTNGLSCTNNNQCVSNKCVDGVCCNNGCGGTCKACSAAKTGGVDGTCGNITTGTDPDNECGGGTPNCNGNGACQ